MSLDAQQFNISLSDYNQFIHLLKNLIAEFWCLCEYNFYLTVKHEGVQLLGHVIRVYFIRHGNQVATTLYILSYSL